MLAELYVTSPDSRKGLVDIKTATPELARTTIQRVIGNLSNRSSAYPRAQGATYERNWIALLRNSAFVTRPQRGVLIAEIVGDAAMPGT